MRIFRVYYYGGDEGTLYLTSSRYGALVWIKDRDDAMTYLIEMLYVDAKMPNRIPTIKATYDLDTLRYTFAAIPE